MFIGKIDPRLVRGFFLPVVWCAHSFSIAARCPGGVSRVLVLFVDFGSIKG